MAVVPYHLESFIGGRSDYENKGVAGSFKSGYGLDIRKQVDSLSGQGSLVDDLALNNKMQAPCYFVVPASDGNTYFFCYNGDILRRNSSGNYLRVAQETGESGHIIGAAEWYDSSGNTYLLWATPTRLHIKKIIGTGYTNVEPWTDVDTSASTGSWPKTNLTSTDFHTMVNANGTLQICNGNVMALVGYDLSYTNDSLDLIPNNNARCILERNKYAVIGCRGTNQLDQTMLFDWDGIGLSWNDKQIIKFKGLNSMIDTEIALAQIGTDGQFYISDFNTPIPFKTIRGGGQTDPDGVTEYQGMALFGIFGNTDSVNGHYMNGVYSIGRKHKNAPIVLNLEYQLDCDEIYSVKTFNSKVYVTYKKNGQYGVKVVDSNTKSDWVYQSLELVAPVGTRRYPNPLGRLLQWATLDIECEPLPPGTDIECWYKIDRQTTGGLNNDGWRKANLQTDNTGSGDKFEDNNMQNATFFLGEKARVFEFMLIGHASGNRTPEVHEANIYYSL